MLCPYRSKTPHPSEKEKSRQDAGAANGKRRLPARRCVQDKKAGAANEKRKSRFLAMLPSQSSGQAE
jgi:hypothetical protein